MVKKGLSLEQKRDIILEIFHEHDDVYQLKEIEKKAAARGVTLQSIKDVVQSLVDDDLVHQEKIGISNFLWSFAAEASTKVKQEEAKLQTSVQAAQADAEAIAENLAAEKAKQCDADAKAALLADIETLKASKAELTQQRQALEVVDPERYAAMKEATGIAKDSANRWLDNTYALQSWTNKKFQGRQEEVDKFFKENGLTDAVDYL